MDFSRILLNWYQDNHRDLPWRHTSDPYLIWLSEVILQQTRVEQGMPYWHKFMAAFPSVLDLANADEMEVLRLWQGLGYYSRARNLQAAAQSIRDKYQGVFPKEYDQIRALKGVGDYTAAAIGSIAFNLNHAVVDGNVYRFLSRLYGIDTAIDSSKGKKEFAFLANELLDKNQPGLFNQAIMEFGAMQCKPANPVCNNCPFSDYCIALKNKSIQNFPYKSKKTKTRNRYFDFLIFTDEKNVLIERRSDKDIWQGLYQFPLIESATVNKSDWNLIIPDLSNYLKIENAQLVKNSSVLKHVLSHQILYAKFWWIKTEDLLEVNINGLIKVPWQMVDDFGMPQLIVKYLESEFN